MNADNAVSSCKLSRFTLASSLDKSVLLKSSYLGEEFDDMMTHNHKSNKTGILKFSPTGRLLRWLPYQSITCMQQLVIKWHMIICICPQILSMSKTNAVSHPKWSSVGYQFQGKEESGSSGHVAILLLKHSVLTGIWIPFGKGGLDYEILQKVLLRLLDWKPPSTS